MCGIVGFSGPPKPYLLTKMQNALFHRGPDDQGQWSSKTASLGFRRLSILDLSGGAQPCYAEEVQVVSVFNGEIYNHISLRQELLSAGHQFHSEHSDAELIPRLYAQFGSEFVHKLNGMFAIAIFDIKSNEWHLFRDHIGIKPLYYAYKNNTLCFASEIKALLVHPDLSRTPDKEALYHYLSFKNIPNPLTAFKDIRQLAPGGHLKLDANGIQLSNWWAIPTEKSTISEEEAKYQLRELLEKSCQLQSQADVEIGAFLSGGVDSASVVALMAEHASNPVKTFTLVYEDDFKNKRQDQLCARQVARQYQTEHHELKLTENEFWCSLEDIVRAFDEPFSGVTSTYFLSRLISQHVKVALSGDGADELFGSYRLHRAAAAIDTLNQDTESKKQSHCREQEFSSEELNRWHQLGFVDFRCEQLLWLDNDKSNLLTPEFFNGQTITRSRDLVKKSIMESHTDSELSRALLHDCKTLLPDQVLTFVDRLAMAHSLEVRPVFLDPEIVRFAFSLPGKLKISASKVKKILKEAVAGLLPEALINRPKEGFVLPVNYWLIRDKQGYLEHLTDRLLIDSQGIFNWKKVKEIKLRAINGEYQAQLRLWNIMMLTAWGEKYL